jgi:glutamate/tyrosine decarboxylase-like PLP-dependent enzyme
LLRLENRARVELWQRVFKAIEDYAHKIDLHRVTPELNPEKIRSLLRQFDFEEPADPVKVLDFTVENLWRFQTHTPHPRYYGLFNPAPTSMGIAADALVAAFNPQLAAWSHSPLAIEIEQHVIRSLGARFGYKATEIDGTFASGGMEANHTAVLTALTHRFPEFDRGGARALAGRPALYVSAEVHHSFLKAARMCGLGTDAVREVALDAELRMDTAALASRLEQDRRDAFLPFLVVGTAGTTNSGIVDPIAPLAEIAGREGLWFHVDAAWGGAAALVPGLKPLLDGIERADSITFDAHKWLSVPMGAGIYLTRHHDILDRTFRTSASYMPREAMGLGVVDPCMHSIQWSRRAIGMKVFLSLAVAGWKGYVEAIGHMVAMGDFLRKELAGSGWEVINKTPLPLVCFVDQRHAEGRLAPYLEAIALRVVASGKAWISTTCLAGSTPVLRACITNYRTNTEDIKALVDVLNWAREEERRPGVGGPG